MSYRQRLAALEESLSSIQPAASRLILLTGQSSFQSSRLSPEQVEFLSFVAPPDAETVRIGFPYRSDFDCAAPPPGMLAASARNALQMWWSLSSPTYRRSAARFLQEVVGKTGESLCIVTGSCGLQILASAWPMLTLPGHLRLCVVAVGPALLRAGALPADKITAIQGRRDFWSRLLYRGRVNARCACGHLDYWSSADSRELVRRLLSEGGEAQ